MTRKWFHGTGRWYLAGVCMLVCAGGAAGAPVAPCVPNTLNNLGGGCEQADKIFTNLALSNSNGPNASLIGTLFTGNPGAGVTASFAATWFAIDTGSPANTHATIGYTVSVDPAIAPPPPNFFFGITSLSLAQVGAVAAGAGASVTIIESFCLNAATFNCTSSSPNYGYIEYQQVRSFLNTTITDSICFNNGGSSCTVTNGSLTLNLIGASFPQGAQQIAVQDVLTLNAPSILRSANLNDISNTFSQTAFTPEPATFALAGLALLGLAAAVRRRGRVG